MKLKYEILMYWSNEDDCFLAEVPELSGCMAHGDTYKEALKNIEIACKLWIETAQELGWNIPVPKGKLYYA